MIANNHTLCYVFLHIHSLVIRQCKPDGAVPTVDVSETSFIAPMGIWFCRVVKSELLHQPKKLLYLHVPLALSFRPMAASR